MDRREIAVLEAELLESYGLIEQVYENILKRRATFRDSEEGVDSIAYRLHNLYGAYERLFEIVVGFFENQIEGTRYHADMLRRMKMKINGITRV